MKPNLSRSDLQDAIKLVEAAQEQMREALETLKQYVDLTGDHSTDAYIVDHLEIMTTEEHEFLSNDRNLDNVLAELTELLDETPDDDSFDPSPDPADDGMEPLEEDEEEDGGCPCDRCVAIREREERNGR